MKIQWSPTAVADLESIREYIARGVAALLLGPALRMPLRLSMRRRPSYTEKART
jgi:plasmid stabilization system protein ParE